MSGPDHFRYALAFFFQKEMNVAFKMIQEEGREISSETLRPYGFFPRGGELPPVSSVFPPSVPRDTWTGPTPLENLREAVKLYEDSVPELDLSLVINHLAELARGDQPKTRHETGRRPCFAFHEYCFYPSDDQHHVVEVLKTLLSGPQEGKEPRE